jgi:transposase
MPFVDPPELTGNPKRLTGRDRDRYAAYVHKLYTDWGLSTREIARETGRSFGTIHTLLAEYGTKKRPEGHQLGAPMHRKREGTEETIEVLDRKGNGRWGPIG